MYNIMNRALISLPCSSNNIHYTEALEQVSGVCCNQTQISNRGKQLWEHLTHCRPRTESPKLCLTNKHKSESLTSISKMKNSINEMGV